MSWIDRWLAWAWKRRDWYFCRSCGWGGVEAKIGHLGIPLCPDCDRMAERV